MSDAAVSDAPPQPPFRAVIFDMDGVLTDSEPAFYAAFNDVLAHHGTSIPMDKYMQFIGSATPTTWRGVIDVTGIERTVEEMIEEYEEPLMARLREPRPPLPGARTLVEKLKARGVPIAVATASYSRWADAVLGAAGIRELFDVLSTADMVEHTKPDPAPYVLAAELLGLPPTACVAIEDSTSGVTSALRAGAHVIQLRATDTSAPPVDGVARIISSLAEFPLELVTD